MLIYYLFGSIYYVLLLNISKYGVIFISFFSLWDITLNLGWLVFIAYVPLFFILKNKSIIFIFFFSIFTQFMQYGINYCFLIKTIMIFSNICLINSIFIYLILVLLNAVYVALIFIIIRYMSLCLHLNIYVLCAPICCCFCYLYNYIFLGNVCFGNIVYALSNVQIFLQGVSIFGIYGMISFIIFVNNMIVEIIWNAIYRLFISKILYLLFCICILLFYVFGCCRLLYFKNDSISIKIGLLQGNITDNINTSFYGKNNIFNRYIRLQNIVYDNGVKIIVWPENSWPQVVNRKYVYLNNFSFKSLASLIGAITVLVYLDDIKYYNSAIMLSNKRHMNIVDKTYLVPFSEYMPWPISIFLNLDNYNYIDSYNIHANIINILLYNDLYVKSGISICYDDMFPIMFKNIIKHGVELIVNISNDMWFNSEIVAKQHFNIDKIRAVETGRCFIRTANNGISGIVNSVGVSLNSTFFNKISIVIDDIYLSYVNTIYNVIGDIVPYCFFCVFMIFLIKIIYSL